MAHVVRTVGGAIESDMLGIVLKLATSKEEAQRVCAANVRIPHTAAVAHSVPSGRYVTIRKHVTTRPIHSIWQTWGLLQLLTGFAEGLEKGPFEERAVPRIIELAEDQEFRVRKVGCSASTSNSAPTRGVSIPEQSLWSSRLSLSASLAAARLSPAVPAPWTSYW